MSLLKLTLQLCSGWFCFVSLVYVIALIHSIGCHLFKKRSINWGEFHPKRFIPGDGATRTLLIILFLIGGANVAFSQFASKAEIGAFYELGKYETTYEATVYIDEKPVFCLVEFYRYAGQYTLSNILLPNGKSEYLDDEYDPECAPVRINLGDWGWDCDIALDSPATERSYAKLDNFVVSNYGEFCASKTSNSYHLRDCRHAKNITSKNYIYFETQKEAEVCGYQFCAECNDRY